jgi:exodeoxyribonuclease VIII
MMRGRPDALGDNLIVDLKTAQDASPDAFARTAANFGYHAQAAYYLDGLRNLGYCDEQAVFLFVVVEKTPPFGVAVYALDDDAIEAGRAQYEDAWSTYRSCRASNNWPSYPGSQKIETLSLPRWAVR